MPGTIIRKVSTLAVMLLSMVALLGAPASVGARNVFSENHTTNASQNYGHTLKYVALGDSVAAGLGVEPALTDTSEDAACGRSEGAYSSHVARYIDEVFGKIIQYDTELIACQGARTQHFTQNQVINGSTIEPQIDQAFAGGKPALATITMGANDIQWAQFISLCFSQANCATEENTDAVQALTRIAKFKLAAALSSIKQRSGFIPPLVVVTGYYNPVSDLCTSSTLTADEVAWISDQTQAFNNALRRATQMPGTGWFTEFAPVDFTGHDICSTDSWIQRPGVPGEPAPFHPTARGQKAIADAVWNKIF